MNDFSGCILIILYGQEIHLYQSSEEPNICVNVKSSFVANTVVCCFPSTSASGLCRVEQFVKWLWISKVLFSGDRSPLIFPFQNLKKLVFNIPFPLSVLVCKQADLGQPCWGEAYMCVPSHPKEDGEENNPRPLNRPARSCKCKGKIIPLHHTDISKMPKPTHNSETVET